MASNLNRKPSAYRQDGLLRRASPVYSPFIKAPLSNMKPASKWHAFSILKRAVISILACKTPTNDAVAAKIAALEGGVAGMLTSSGQAANFYAIFNICQAGDHCLFVRYLWWYIQSLRGDYEEIGYRSYFR